MKGKAQSEIMGLAMIMIIITIGLAILVRFSIQGSDDQVDFVSSFTENELALFYNDALINTHIQECGKSLQGVIRDCLDTPRAQCRSGIVFPGGNISTPSDPDVCSIAERFLEESLEKGLGSNFFEYRFTVYTGNDFTDESKWKIYLTNTDCIQTIDGRDIPMRIPRPGIIPLKYGGGTFHTKLDLCFEQ